MDNNFNRIKKNTKHKSAGVHIPLNPLSASSSSEIMSNRRHYLMALDYFSCLRSRCH